MDSYVLNVAASEFCGNRLYRCHLRLLHVGRGEALLHAEHDLPLVSPQMS
jgi:hypothetical protein